MKRALSVMFAPTMLLGFNAAAIWIVEARAGLVWLAPLLIAAIVLATAVERAIPCETAWNQPRGDVRRDLVHAAVNQTLNLAFVGLIPLVSFLHPWPSIWPQAWPMWAQLLLAILGADAGISLTHYLSHRWAPLWRVHAVHHSLRRMYAFNGLMKHPLHQAIEVFAGGAPLVLVLGMPPVVGLLLAFAVAIQLLVQHSNAEMRIGPLAWLLAIGPVHRRHHRRVVETAGVNFGLFTNLWDYLLGTAEIRERTPIDADALGLADRADYPRDYLDQLVEPFAGQSA